MKQIEEADAALSLENYDREEFHTTRPVIRRRVAFWNFLKSVPEYFWISH